MATTPSTNDPQSESETLWEQASQWISRTIAVTVVMVLPGILGAMLDKRFGTTFLAPCGFGLGLIAGTTGLIILGRLYTPPARGNPLPWQEEDSPPNEPHSDDRQQ